MFRNVYRVSQKKLCTMVSYFWKLILIFWEVAYIIEVLTKTPKTISSETHRFSSETPSLSSEISRFSLKSKTLRFVSDSPWYILENENFSIADPFSLETPMPSQINPKVFIGDFQVFHRISRGFWIPKAFH